MWGSLPKSSQPLGSRSGPAVIQSLGTNKGIEHVRHVTGTYIHAVWYRCKQCHKHLGQTMPTRSCCEVPLTQRSLF